jgi:hypothetical protein
MIGPIDNAISDSESDSRTLHAVEEEIPEVVLPNVVRGRMFCVSHGRQCYRGMSLVGENVWICPDERHSNPIPG